MKNYLSFLTLIVSFQIRLVSKHNAFVNRLEIDFFFFKQRTLNKKKKNPQMFVV